MEMQTYFVSGKTDSKFLTKMIRIKSFRNLNNWSQKSKVSSNFFNLKKRRKEKSKTGIEGSLKSRTEQK